MQDSRSTQKRADFMYSVKEKARKITCSTETDEMNVKRTARYLKGVPSAKCLIEINTVRERVHRQQLAGQHQTCKSTSGGVTQWEKRDSFGMVKKEHNSQ